MGMFLNRSNKILYDICQKSEYHNNDLAKEIDDFFEDLKSEYEQNRLVLKEFKIYLKELESKLSLEENNKLQDFSTKLERVKRCAKKGVESMRELARDQRKMSRETIRDYEDYFTT